MTDKEKEVIMERTKKLVDSLYDYIEKENIQIKDLVRIDTYFNNVFEMDKDGEWSVGCYSQGSWTEGYTQIWSVPNQQDFSNSILTADEIEDMHDWDNDEWYEEIYRELERVVELEIYNEDNELMNKLSWGED